MKIKIIAGTMVALSFSLMSCSDFLTEDPRGKLTPENFFSTQDELNMSIYALYQKVNLSQVYTNMQLPQWQGDDITTNSGSNKQPAAEMDKFAAANNNKGVKDAWNMHYAIVKAANLIIQGASKTPTTQDEINIALGQAKFWRAYAYFTLVRLWGPLPMNLDNVNDDYTKPLSPVEEVYGHIVQDLTEAEAVLPTGYSGSPRFLNGVNVYVTRQAAKSTLAAVYMAMAGWPMNKTEYYAKAAEKAKEVIEGVNRGEYEYKLDKDYKDVYAMSNNYNNETVLGINYSPFVDWAQDSELTSCNQFESLGGWGDAWGEIRFWKEFLEMRKEQGLVHIAEAALQAQEKGVPKRLISAVFAEQSSLFRFSYERPDDAFSSGDAAYSALRALPDRMEIQQAKEVLKYAECLYSSPEYSEIKAVRLLMADARRNGPDELERLFQTTGTVAGALYVRILFSRLEPQGKRVFPVLNGEVKLERNGVIETVPAKIFFSSRDRFREALLSAWFSGK